MCSSLVPPNATEDGPLSYRQEEHASITPEDEILILNSIEHDWLICN